MKLILDTRFLSPSQQENSLLVRSFMLAVNASGVHLVYGREGPGVCGGGGSGLGGSGGSALAGAALPQLSLQTTFVSYSYSRLVHVAPDVDALALTVRGPTQEIEQFVLKTSQVTHSTPLTFSSDTLTFLA